MARFPSTTDKIGSLVARNPHDHVRIENHNLDEISAWLSAHPFDDVLISATAEVSPTLLQLCRQMARGTVELLTHETSVPIRNLYRTPQTLGTDRLAAAVGAHFQAASAGVGRPSLIVDAGTAITYDFVTADGRFLGGNIAPGLEMRFRALHEFTARLPLCQPSSECGSIATDIRLGDDTESAIQYGVAYGVQLEISGYIRHFVLKYPNLAVFFTGGYRFDFDDQLKNRIFVDEFLVLKGLDLILQHCNCIR